MKNLPNLYSMWDSGDFTGSRRNFLAVTVEPEWFLDKISLLGDDNTGWPAADRPGPWRYFQQDTGPIHTEVELPNVKSVDKDSSIETDAASCKITFYNQINTLVDVPELVSQFGSPGALTWDRGDSPDAQARWNHTQNEFYGILVPMALLRTYEGFGGYSETVVEGPMMQPQRMNIADAVNGGTVTKTGTWFVDSVTVNNKGELTVSCRDAAKFLIEQMIFPPLIPDALNPLKYYRWKDESYNAIWDPGAALNPGGQTIPITYNDSSSDVIVGQTGANVSVSNQFPSYACDGDESTYALGYGYDNPDGPEVVDWWNFNVATNINRVYLSPWEGGYTCYISIYENGAWQGDQTIPYTPGGLGDISAAIPYVVSTGLSRETPVTIDLPRVYNAVFVRISLRNMSLTTMERPYRSGLRQVEVGLSSVAPNGWTFSLARHPGNGYWVVAANGQQFYFGDARQLTENNPRGISTNILAADSHPTQEGFWTVEANGRVHAFGASQYFGDIADLGFNDTVDIASTHTGNGYWVLRRSGGVYTFGDAQYLGGTFNGGSVLGELPPASPLQDTASAMVGDPSGMGYWITDFQGKVGYFGSASFHGEVTPPLPDGGNPATIEPTADGGGYWILWSNGQIFAYGNATNEFSPGAIGSGYSAAGYGGVWWEIVRSNTPLPNFEQGFWALRADGMIAAFGSNYFGRPGETGATLRSDGNYKDYSDIIKDLLGWAGFTLVSIGFEAGIVGIHGTIETTGAYAEEALSEDIFDKKPIIDAIRTFTEIVGYIYYVDSDGGFHWCAPNWWAPGNFYEDGTRVGFIPEIDEELQLFDYNITFADDSLRSEIIIANQLPTSDNTSTIVSRYVPPGQEILRGMVRPAIWTNEVFNRASEQQIMAELIGMHIWFSQREGNVTCVANPAIGINDQVRIWERVTGESYIHYVRGGNTSNNLEAGEDTMTLSTHWLGSDSSWVIRMPGAGSGSGTGAYSVDQNRFVEMSPELVAFLTATGSATADPTYFIGYTS